MSPSVESKTKSDFDPSLGHFRFIPTNGHATLARHVAKVPTTDMHRKCDLAFSTGIKNIEHRAVGVSTLRASSDCVRQDGFELHEVGELIANARQMRARNLMHVSARRTFWPS